MEVQETFRRERRGRGSESVCALVQTPNPRGLQELGAVLLAVMDGVAQAWAEEIRLADAWKSARGSCRGI